MTQGSRVPEKPSQHGWELTELRSWSHCVWSGQAFQRLCTDFVSLELGLAAPVWF